MPFFTFFCGNHKYTVGGGATVKRCGVCSFQHGNRFDVVGVELGKGIATFFRTVDHHSGATGVHIHLSGHVVLHGHTVDNDKRRVVTHHGCITAKQDFGGSTGSPGVRRDDQTCTFPLQRVDEVGLFGASELIASDGLRRVGKGFFFTSDTHSRDHDFVEQLRVVLHHYIDFIMSVDGTFDSLVTDVGKFQFVASCRHFDRIVPIDVGCRRYTGSRNLYGEANECFAGGIGNVTGYNFRVGTLSRCTCASDISLCRYDFFRQHDVGILYRVRNVGPFE